MTTKFLSQSLRFLAYTTVVLSIFCILSPTILTYAQSGYKEGVPSFSGDERCGRDVGSECNLITDGVLVLKSTLLFLIYISLPILIVILSVRIIQAYFAAVEGNANAYKELGNKARSSFIGFLILSLLASGVVYTLLQFAGVKEFALPLVKKLGEALVTHAYAADAPYLPNPLQSDNFFDLILSLLRLVMRFFVYPGLIVLWVWTGFSFVAAQGNPDGLNKAKKMLMWAFVSTVVIVMLQGFLLAAKATVDTIFNKKAQQQQSQQQEVPVDNGTLDGRAAPQDGTYGSVCTTNGAYGTYAQDGKTCLVGRGASSNMNGYCAGKAFGTLCTIPNTTLTGTCSNGFETQVFSCNRAMKGDDCIAGNGVNGTIAEDQATCTPSGKAAKTQQGGSCQLDIQCAGDLTCINTVCQKVGGTCTTKSGGYGMLTTDGACQGR